MVTATSLKDQVNGKVREIRDAVAAVSEEKASQAPAPGEWCVKEVLSHLTGREADYFFADLKRFLDEDTPTLDIVPGVTHFDDSRQAKTTAGLMAAVEKQYGEIADFLGSLSEEQLARKGHVALLKDSPIGEYPTLGQWAGALANFHLAQHVEQLRSLSQ